MKPRVYFFTGSTAHNFYVHQFACSPERVEMVPGTQDLTGSRIKKDIAAMGTRSGNLAATRTRAATGALKALGIPNGRRVNVDADLIHSAQHVVWGGKPWVLDFEDVSVLFWYGARSLRHPVARSLVGRALTSEKCRRLLPWTEAARRSLESLFTESAIHDKTQVVYPAISRVAKAPKKHGNDGTVRLLFVGSRFYAKGGVEVLRVFERLRKRFPVELTMITIVPPEMGPELARVDGVTVLSKVPPEQIEAEFARADLFVMTSHMDTFGFVFLEAFANGIPCVSTTHFATPEIISAGVTGLLVESENSYFGPDFLPRSAPIETDQHPIVERLRHPSESYLSALEEEMERLIEDPSLRGELGANAYNEVIQGRFSCRRHTEAMDTIYKEALEA